MKKIYWQFNKLIIVLVIVLALNNKTTASDNESTLNIYLPIETIELPRLPKQLTQFLSQALQQKVVVHTSELWHHYQQDIRHGKHSIVFSAPHFAAWSIHYNNFVPMLKVKQPINYLLVARSKDKVIFELSDLANKPVCIQQPLNLDYLLLQTQFTNSISTPYIEWATPSMTALIKGDQKCRAFMVIETVFEQLPQHSKSTWIKLYQSSTYSNYVWLAHPEIKKPIIQTLQKALLSKQGEKIIQPLLQRYASKTQLIEATTNNYPASYTKLLTKYWH